MDKTLKTIVEFCTSHARQGAGEHLFLEFKRRWMDVAGVALAALDQPAYLIAKDLALQTAPTGACQLLGTPQRTSAEMAAFANGVLIRCLDGADTYPGGGGHPSDCWAALLALAEENGNNLDELCCALNMAYAFYWYFFNASALKDHGLDNTCYVGFASALGGAHLLGLSPERMAHALSMVVSSSLSLGVARSGELSMWKSAASAHAAKQGVFAARLARLGMSAPHKPFEGDRGLWPLTKEIQLTFPPQALRQTRQEEIAFERAHMKYYLCEYHCQTPIMAALELTAKLKDKTIATVNICTYRFALQEVAHGLEKWQPLTRETADHSMPWSVASVLNGGEFRADIYEPSRLQDPKVQALAQRITVREDPVLTQAFPESTPCVMEIKTLCGETHRAEVLRALGHPKNPMSTVQVQAKFRDLSQRHLSPSQVDAFFDRLEILRPQDPVARLMHTMALD